VGDRILRSCSIGALACALGSAAWAAPGGRVTGKVTVTDADGKAASTDVIVYVVGFPEAGATGKPTAQIAQKGPRTAMPSSTTSSRSRARASSIWARSRRRITGARAGT
jgi:hypothetical protein